MTRIDKYEIAARIGLAGLEGYRGTLTAAQQRMLFGRYIFGKMTVSIAHTGTSEATTNGRVHGSRQVCFGTDFETFDLDFERIAAIANTPHKGFEIAGRIFSARERK